jgi:hypothetical protein
MKFIFSLLFLSFNLVVFSQTPTYDDLVFEDDSITKAYKPSGKNYAFIKSKKGSGGVARTTTADSILGLPVTDIILVFTESNASQMAEREEANQERWENLIQTYPKLFQFNTNYKNILQYGKGSEEEFKNSQGFYVYYESKEKKSTPEKKADPIVKETKSEKETISKNEVTKENTNSREKISETKESREEKKEKKVKEEKSTDKNEITSVSTETVNLNDVPVKGIGKPGFSKPRKAKNPKACRVPCYEGGDEDLNTYFKTSINLSKKQRRHGKNLVSQVRLMLNIDGSIKKAMVTGTDEVLNQQVAGAVKNMNAWNPAVKNGVTVKSDVKITLKYDKETKALKPFEVVVNPRVGPKCDCVSDAEMFGD